MNHIKKNQEMKVYGRHAAMKIFENRPDDVIRAYITKEGIFEFKDLIKHLADRKLAYHIVEKAELDTVTKATHHENICLVVKTRPQPTLRELLNSKGRQLILCLEEVENPHNLGAILRSCAHFGVSGVVYEAKVPVASSASAVRTAEGGAESVPAVHIDSWNDVFEIAKKQNFKVFSTSSHNGKSLFKVEFPEKVLLFLGAEGPGLSKKIMEKASELIEIPGTGNVESLNVSNATVAILTEWYRQGLVK